MFNKTIHIIANIFMPTNKKYLFSAHNMKTFQLIELFVKHGHEVVLYADSDAHKNISFEDTNISFEHIAVIDVSEYDEIKKATNDFNDMRYMVVGMTEFDFLRKKIIKKFLIGLNSTICKKYKNGDVVLHVCDNFSSSDFDIDMNHIDACNMGGYPYSENVVCITREYKKYMEVNHPCFKNKNTIIINQWFNPKYFYLSKKYKDTFLYLARCSELKGFCEILWLASSFPQYQFWIAGPCISYDSTTKIIQIDGYCYESHNPIIKTFDLSLYKNIKYFGTADLTLRNKLLSEASALIQPTRYSEPCGWNVIESLFSGTPVIVPHRGGFINTTNTDVAIIYEYPFFKNIDIWSIMLKHVQTISSTKCREYAITKFSSDEAYDAYIQFFYNITNNF